MWEGGCGGQRTPWRRSLESSLKTFQEGHQFELCRRYLSQSWRWAKTGSTWRLLWTSDVDGDDRRFGTGCQRIGGQLKHVKCPARGRTWGSRLRDTTRAIWKLPSYLQTNSAICRRHTRNTSNSVDHSAGESQAFETARHWSAESVFCWTSRAGLLKYFLRPLGETF